MTAHQTVLPVISFAAFASGDQLAKQRVAQQIAQACQTYGFFYLDQHGLSSDQIAQAFSQAKNFFDQPLAVKKQMQRQPQTNCGYVSLQSERLNPNRPGDLKEALNVGIETQWLPELSSVQAVIEPFYQACIAQVALPLLEALALALELPESFFVERHGQNFFLRLLHYPPLLRSPDANQLRAGEHTDYGTVTLLFQNAIEGLEIYTQQGNWSAAPALNETILVNLGDALQRWTNDQFRSTPHRVALPADNSQSRYSMALFCDPNSEVEIACLPSCQILEPLRYAPIQYQDYLQSRFAETY